MGWVHARGVITGRGSGRVILCLLLDQSPRPKFGLHGAPRAVLLVRAEVHRHLRLEAVRPGAHQHRVGANARLRDKVIVPQKTLENTGNTLTPQPGLVSSRVSFGTVVKSFFFGGCIFTVFFREHGLS